MSRSDIIVNALAAGAAAHFRPNVYGSGEDIDDQYLALKELIENSYPDVEADLLDIAPGSDARKALLAQQLQEAGAEADTTLLSQAQALLVAIHEKLPNAAEAAEVSETEIAEIISLDMDQAPRDSIGLEEETVLDLLRDSQTERYEDEVGDYTIDPEIRDEFRERQELGYIDEPISEMDEEEYTEALSPELSGGDVDAAWEDSNISGEESVGGTAVTPDQDRVDELGEAMGLTYDDDEPLNTEERLRARDRNRWELNPASADEDDMLEEEEG